MQRALTGTASDGKGETLTEGVKEVPTFFTWLMASLSIRLLKIMMSKMKQICVKSNDKFIFRAREFGSVEYLGRTTQ